MHWPIEKPPCIHFASCDKQNYLNVNFPVFLENMVIFGKINDIDPVMDPVYKDRNHTITGQKNFVGLVVIDGNAEIITVNGINLYNISNIVLTKGEFHLSDEKVWLYDSNTLLTKSSYFFLEVVNLLKFSMFCTYSYNLKASPPHKK